MQIWQIKNEVGRCQSNCDLNHQFCSCILNHLYMVEDVPNSVPIEISDNVGAAYMGAFGVYYLKLDSVSPNIALLYSDEDNDAEDSVGNSTGVLEYSFTFKDKSVFVKYYENKPVFYSTTTLFAVLVIGGISLIAIRKHAKRI